MDITAANLERLTTAVRASYRVGMNGYTPIYQKVATVIPSTSGAENYAWLGEFTRLKKWIGARQVSRMKNSGFTITNEKYEGTEGIPGEYVRDDKYGLLMKKFEDMGYAASCHPDELTFALLAAGFNEECYDGQPFFDTDHDVNGASASNMQAGSGQPWFILDTNRPLKPLIFQKREDYDIKSKTDPNNSDHVFMHDEYLYGVDARVNAGFGFWQMAHGAKSDLTSANLWTGIKAMRTQKSDEGRPLGIRPNMLVVHPDHEDTATVLLKNLLKDGGGTNELAGRLELVVADFL